MLIRFLKTKLLKKNTISFKITFKIHLLTWKINQQLNVQRNPSINFFSLSNTHAL